MPRRALAANATDVNAYPNPWALSPYSPTPHGDGYGPTANAMGGIVDDQFVMAVPPRIAAACGFPATPAPAMRDGVCRAQGMSQMA